MENNLGARLRCTYYHKLNLPVPHLVLSPTSFSFAGSLSTSSSLTNSPRHSETVVQPAISPREKYLLTLIQQHILTFPAERAKTHQTLLIFDWDDTLLCTSYLSPTGARTVHRYHEFLRELEVIVARLLELALQAGDVYIITNSDQGWVEWTANKYIPLVVPVLKRIKIVSARRRYERQFPGDSARWKMQAFLDTQKSMSLDMITNIVAVGDSHMEMLAAHYLASQFKNAFIKTVKFLEQPLPQELIKEINLVTKDFDVILNKPKSLMISLDKRQNALR